MQLPTVKTSTKKQINKLKIKTAKFLAYVMLVLAASYGFRSALSRLDDVYQLIITAALVLSLIFITTLNEE